MLSLSILSLKTNPHTHIRVKPNGILSSRDDNRKSPSRSLRLGHHESQTLVLLNKVWGRFNLSVVYIVVTF